ncbi:MAG: SDR family NAD(P)-dependent oxidoreductase [Candidatus Faecivicinus sp.]
MRIGIVTGASSGLGREFVRQITAQMPEIREIWAIARRRERLDALKAELGDAVRPLALDLTDESSIQTLEGLLAMENPDIAILVNAAGVGRIGSCSAIRRQDLDEMINLNCRAAVDVTAICIPHMKPGARILEICSTAAFQPFQHLNVYAASKAFLYRYSRALYTELFTSGIRVTAVCPYWVRDTEFIPIAKNAAAPASIRHFPLASRSRRVVRRALRDSRIGIPVSTPGPACFLHRIVAKLVPSQFMMGLWAILRRI